MSEINNIKLNGTNKSLEEITKIRYNGDEYPIGGGNAGGSSGVIEVDELPTENIDENAIYKVNGYTDIDVYVKTGDNVASNLYEVIASLGAIPSITYYLVDNLPSSPNVSNLLTFSPAHVYIYNDVAYVYGNAGYGNMWLGVKDLITQTTGIVHENKGYCRDRQYIDSQGCWVTYKKVIGGGSTYASYIYNGNWINYESIFTKEIKTFNNPTINTIPINAFSFCRSLTDVNVPNVTLINDSAFNECTNLTNIMMPNVVEIGNSAFMGCKYLTNVSLPSSLQRIGQNAFFGCFRLQSIIVPEKVNEIESNAFYQCGLTSVELPEGLTSIESFAFYGCEYLKSINIPNSVTRIDSSVFEKCMSLTSMVLPQNLPYISGYTFYGCKNLKEIVIPKSVKDIGINAFNTCDSLKNVYYTGSETEWKAINNRSSSDLEDVTIHYNYVPE